MTSSKCAPLLNLFNQLKQSASRTELVQSQREAVRQIRSLHDEFRMVGLVGPESVGKTYIAWVLYNDYDFTYHHWPPANLETGPIVVDDAPSDRVRARALRSQCRINDIEGCVYITNRDIMQADTIPTVSLTLTATEQRSIINKWVDLLDISEGLKSATLESARQELNRYTQ